MTAIKPATFRVDGMICAGCDSRVERAVAALPGWKVRRSIWRCAA